MIERILKMDAKLSYALRVSSVDGVLGKMFAFFAHSGDSWFWLAGMGVIWIFAKGDWHNYAGFLAISIFALAVLVMAIKFSVKRTRPPGEWGEVYRATDPHSFPSGHAARAIMLAVLALVLGPHWFGILVVIWAPLVTLARVVMGLHYISDVVVGALLGLLSGYVFIWLYPWMLAYVPIVFK